MRALALRRHVSHSACMLTSALAALVLAAGPPVDIASAAHALAPPGARVVLAQERSWDRGIAAWDNGRTVTAAPLEWRARAWRRTRGGGVTFGSPLVRVTGRSVYVEIHVTMREPLVDDAVFIDGRPADSTDFPGPTRGISVTIATHLARGRHVAVAYAAIRGSATTRAWTFRVR